MEKYYEILLASETSSGNNIEPPNLLPENKGSMVDSVCEPEKWKGQIEKVSDSVTPSTPQLYQMEVLSNVVY